MRRALRAATISSSTPYNPVDVFGSDLSFFWDPSDSARVTKDGSNLVSQMADRGPLARHGNATGTARPVLATDVQDYNDNDALTLATTTLLSADAWSAEAQPRTFAVVARQRSTTQGFLFDQQGATEQSLQTSNNWWIGGATQVDTTYGFTPIVGASGSNTGQSRPFNDVAVLWMEFNGAASTFYVNNSLKATVDAGTAASTTFQLGARRSGFGSFWDGDVALVMCLRSRLATTAERLAFHTYAMRRFLPGQIIFPGDSLTLGREATPLPDAAYPETMKSSRLLGRPFCMRNQGVGSRMLQTIVANAATEIDPLYNVNRPFNFISVMAGLNDASGGRTAAQIYGDLVTFANARAAVGWTVFADTMADAALTAPQTAERLAANVLIKANASGGAYTLPPIPTSDDPKFQNRLDTLYFNVDQTHWTNLGYSLKAARTVGHIIPSLP